MNDDLLYRAKKSVGPGLADHSAQPDMARMRGYRMRRLQAGSIHVYLAYVFVTLILLLLFGVRG